MEYCSNGRKRGGGFMKAGKQLMIPFYRSTPKSAQYCNSTVGCSTKVNISTTAANSHTTASSSALAPHKLVPFVNVPQTTDHHLLLLHQAAGDLQVDAKAASYISAVQERFKMERINSERMKLQLQDSPHSDDHHHQLAIELLN